MSAYHLETGVPLTGYLHPFARSAGLIAASAGGIRVLFAHGCRRDPIVAIIGIGLEHEHLLELLAETLRQRIALAIRQLLTVPHAQPRAISRQHFEFVARAIRLGAGRIFLQEFLQ